MLSGWVNIVKLIVSAHLYLSYISLIAQLYLHRGSGIPELKNQVKKPSYGLWCHKTELSQIVTSS